MIVVINGPLCPQTTRVVYVLARWLRADWAAIDPIGQLESLTDCLPYGAATILYEALSIAHRSLHRRRRLVLNWRLDEAGYRWFLAAMQGIDDAVVVVTLAPQRSFALSGQKGAWDRKAIRRFYVRGRHRPKFGMVIDNSEQAPQQTAALIVAHLRREMLLA
jgi:hypothetical protein